MSEFEEELKEGLSDSLSLLKETAHTVLSVLLLEDTVYKDGKLEAVEEWHRK